MGKENNIDDLFRQKLANDEVAYSEAAWSGASNLLDKHFKWLFLKKLAIWIAPIITAAGLGLYLLSSSDSTETIAQPTMAGTEMLSTEMNSNTDNIDNASITSIVSQQSIIDSDKNANSIAESTRSGESVSEITSTKASEKLVKNSASNSSFAQLSMSSINTDDLSASDDGSVASREEDNSNPEFSPSFNTSTPAKQAKRKNLDFMPWSRLGIFGSISQPDVLDRATESLKQERMRSFLVQAQVGGLWGERLRNTGTDNTAFPFGGYAGLHAEYFIQPNVSLGFGSILHTRSNLNSDYVNTETGLKESSLMTTYLDLSLDVRFNLYKRHSLGFGIAFSPLVNHYKEIDGKKEFNADGFAEMDAAGLLNYQFALTEKVKFQATYRYGLFDLTDDKYFGTGEVDDRNHQVRLGLSYRLLQR